MRKKNTIIFLLIFLLCILLLTSCAPGNAKYVNHRPANFLSGIWHGWIAPFTLIISIFNINVHMYEIHNTGWWYNFGYYIAIIGGFGSVALFRRKHKDKD